MRVVFTIGSLDANDGGPSRTVPSLCEALVRDGVSAHIVTCAGPVRAEYTSGVRTRVVPYRHRRLRSVWGAPFQRAVVDLARSTRAELIHDNGVWLQTNHAASVAARALGLPAVISPRGMLEPWSLGHRAVKKWLAWRAFQRRDLAAARLLHATSEMEADNLRRLGFYQPIAIIPNGVTTPEIGIAVRNTADPKRQHIALFLSRLHPKKGLITLVEAWARARPTGWRMVIAGPDENGHQAEVAAAARAAGVTSSFEFIGSVEGEAKRLLYEQADLFVLPTASENFGVVIAEALSYEIPVITTKGTPWSDLAAHRCGWWIDLGVDPLVAALQHATALSDEDRAAMGGRGREWVLNRFGWPGIAREMHDVYRWMLRGGPKPECIREV